MATPPTSPPPAHVPPAPPTAAGPHRKEIKLISHSPIFYWWPIWVIGFVFALITYADDSRLAIIPNGPGGIKVSELAPPDDAHSRFEVIAPKRNEKENDSRPSLHNAAEVGRRGDTNVLKPRVSPRAWLGPVYLVILLLTILSTNVQLRGLWSFLVLLVLILIALLFTVFDVWDSLLRALGGLHVYINMAGYLFIACTVGILWFVSVFVFDQRTYIIFTPGQIRVCEHIGASVRNFDSTGLTFEKQRDDLFRHWILGFFSGDLIVRTSGAEREEIRLPNILWIGWKLEEVQEILRQKETVMGK